VTWDDRTFRLCGFYISLALLCLGTGSLLAGGRHYIPLSTTCGAGGLACTCASAVWRRGWLFWAAAAFFAAAVAAFFLRR
jgi:hypothetical protein